MILYRHCISFSAAHFYNQKRWPEAKNRAAFGLCYGLGHGHDYKVEFSFDWQQCQAQLDQIKSSLENLQRELNHKFLNHEIDFFKDQIPTSENIGIYLLERFHQLGNARPLRVKVFERPDLWANIEA
jgi:6-pyruvoyltetrahydropterin/6-carboxytetrahydropterin synthase